MNDTAPNDTTSTDAAPSAAPEPTENTAVNNAGSEGLEQQIIAALKTVYDPEIPVDIYELGLIYEMDIDPENNVDIVMTLTAPGCPVAGSMPGWVQQAVESVPGVNEVDVEMAWEPPWTPEMMSMRAKLELNML